jgi:hypothetical protein
MRLVTFPKSGGAPRAGALVDGDVRIFDLAEAHQAAFGAPGFESVLVIVEGGDAALGKAYEAMKKAPAVASVARADVRLRAPIQPPPQMRDCLCFELHLQQTFAASRKITAMQGPEKALAELERNGPQPAPPIFYKQPIYYKANRFAVIGTDDDVVPEIPVRCIGSSRISSPLFLAPRRFIPASFWGPARPETVAGSSICDSSSPAM